MTLVIWNRGTKAWEAAETPPPPPKPEGFPDRWNTGFQGNPTTLPTINGKTYQTPGEVIENVRIVDAIRPDAANIIIRNCIILGGHFGVAATENATNLIVEDCTVIGGNNCGITLDGPTGAIVRRCNISGGADGMKVRGTNLEVSDTYIHDLAVVAGESHNDGIQCGSGTGLVFRHNSIASPDTSCIAMFKDQGTWSDVLIEDNFLTGPGWVIYAPGPDGVGIRIRNNLFGTWGYGPVTDWNPGAVGNEWSNNTRLNGDVISPL
jgi:hypothetical protein